MMMQSPLSSVPDKGMQYLKHSFEKLRKKVYAFIETTEPDKKELVFLVSCPMPTSRKKRSKQITGVDLDCIMQPGTQFHQMFKIIDKYTNWYNYELLESIIQKYGNVELKEAMKEYSSEVGEYIL